MKNFDLPAVCGQAIAIYRLGRIEVRGEERGEEKAVR